MVVVILTVGAGTDRVFAAAITDNFDDGVIDTNLWDMHGYKFNGTGSWQWSFAEQTATDGYLQARVWGPTSGGSLGAEARVRMTKNFNDGNPWLINFTWETLVHESPHCDVFALRISDGATPESNGWPWPWKPMPAGTVNLWQTSTESGPFYSPQDTPLAPFTKSQWSVSIDPSGTASLYQSPDGQGSVFRNVSLDPSKGWYLQFIVNDATSSGFVAGDCSFKLYDFSATPEPGTLSLLALGGMALLRRRK